MMALKPGTLFAKHYEVVRVISTGGMGVVYEVTDRNIKRRRALKVMLPHVVTDALMRDRFALEAIVTADIESEHLVEVFDAGIEEETEAPYLVMELLRGEDLGARLKSGERFSAEETLTYLEQVARALQKTHERGIVHRDLKPENLFLTRRDDGSPRVKILDFGIAKIVHSTTGQGASTTKSLGTPYYMAREQITGEAPLIGPASDLYAIAQISYSMLVGSPYFEEEASKAGGNVLSLLLAVGKGPSEPATERASRKGVLLPPAFDGWFEQGTRSVPAERFQAARPMIDALKRALEEPIKYVSVPPPPPGSEQRPSVAATPHSSGSSPSGPTAVGRTVPISEAPHAATPSADVASETGSPQSIPRLVARGSQAPGSALKTGLIAGGLAAVAGVGLWVVLRGSTAGPASLEGSSALPIASSGAPTAPSQAANASAAQHPPNVTAVADPTSAAGATASVEVSSSAAVEGSAKAASATSPRVRNPPPRPSTTTAPPVWETR
ncbi:MAG: protein kinase [Polyangiaceae bacterium]|nr:protein kinase [Polyangiaceae bacterium]